MVFSKQWFGKHQNKLLFLLNNKVTRFIFRRIMRIDCKKDIIALLPNSYIIKGDKKDEYVADFRTHDKYAKRLYYAFKPFWYLIHAFDTLFANKWIPEWNLGFDTLTIYPDAGTGNTTCSGWVTRGGATVIDETFSTIRAGAGDYGSATPMGVSVSLKGSTTTNQFQWLFRNIATFNTDSLTSVANISSAILSLNSTGGEQNALGDPSIHITSSNPASNNTLVSSDYSQLGSTSFSNITFSNWSDADTYNDFTLNSSGISNISKTGISKFGMRLGWDINNSFTGTWSSNGQSNISWYTSNSTGTSKDPKLVVTYTLPITFIPQILFI